MVSDSIWKFEHDDAYINEVGILEILWSSIKERHRKLQMLKF